MVRNLVVVYLSNLVGALIVDAFLYLSGQLDYTGGALGAYTIKVALAKSTMSFDKAFVSGIMCNILVCAAILTAAAAKDIAGKLLAIFFPIWAFVVAGYEQCVANMYYIPAGIMAMKEYGISADGLSWLTFFVRNELPVTLGNIVGGTFIGTMYWAIYLRQGKKEK